MCFGKGSRFAKKLGREHTSTSSLTQILSYTENIEGKKFYRFSRKLYFNTSILHFLLITLIKFEYSLIIYHGKKGKKGM
jgi:hypothetical protein